jgi:hypothetical protein
MARPIGRGMGWAAAVALLVAVSGAVQATAETKPAAPKAKTAGDTEAATKSGDAPSQTASASVASCVTALEAIKTEASAADKDAFKAICDGLEKSGVIASKNVGTGNPIAYSTDSNFDAAVSNSIKYYIPKNQCLIVKYPRNISVNASEIADFAPPYLRGGMREWIVSIERTGGTVKYLNNSHGKTEDLIAVVITSALNAFGDVLTRIKTASLFRPARDVSAVVNYTQEGASKDGVVTSVVFFPRASNIDACNAPPSASK